MLLILWDGHINVQYVTQTGIEQYLVKYISKVEPSHFVNYSKTNNIKSFLDLRVISSLEASALILGHHFVQSNFRVKYLNTTINGANFKFLKTKKQLNELKTDDENIFKESTFDYYMCRPNEVSLNNITYIEYFKYYDIIVKDSNRNIAKKSKDVFQDLKGIIIIIINKIIF